MMIRVVAATAILMLTPLLALAQVPAPATYSIGTFAGEVLTWLAAAFSIPIGALLAAWMVRLFKVAGLEATKQMNDELNKVLVNGLNDAAYNGARLAAGKLPVTVERPDCRRRHRLCNRSRAGHDEGAWSRSK
jgi:hypothetical protein